MNSFGPYHHYGRIGHRLTQMHTDKKEGNWPWMNADKYQPGWTRIETDKTESESPHYLCKSMFICGRLRFLAMTTRANYHCRAHDSLRSLDCWRRTRRIVRG